MKFSGSGERLCDDYTGKVHDYTHRQDILYKEILLPSDAARELADRQTFVSAIDASENDSNRRSDARTAREIKVALPIELSLEDQIALVKGYVMENFVKHGCVILLENAKSVSVVIHTTD